MERTVRRARWRWWGGIAGLAVVLCAVAFSEASGVWYCADPNGPSNFFELDRSSVTVIWYYRGAPDGFFTGIPLYQKGWSTERAMIRMFTPRHWWPVVRVDQTVSFPLVWARMPLWMPVPVFAGLAWWGWRLRRRFGAGRCGKCGYDVRGVVGGVCPECGKSVAPIG